MSSRNAYHPRGKNFISIFVSLVIMLLSYQVFPQESMNIREWLTKRKSSLNLQVQGMEDSRFNPSWIRELEFRTETEDFLLDKQEYLIRYRPTLPRERKAQANLVEISKQEWEINEINFQNKLNRYLLDELMTIRQMKEESIVLLELLQVYLDQRELIRGQISDGTFNIKDVSQADADISAIQGKIQDHQLRLDLLEQKEILPKTEQLISISELSGQLVNQDLSGIPSIDQVEGSFQIKKIDAEIGLERIEGSRIFDFIQLRYSGPHSDLLSERLALGVSIQIPRSSRQQLRMEELRVEQLIRQQQFDQQRQWDSIAMSEDLEELTILIQKWNYNNDRMEDQQENLDSLIKGGLNISYDDPGIILYQKEQLLKLRQDQIRFEGDIYRLYLDLLERTIILGEESFYTFIIEP